MKKIDPGIEVKKLFGRNLKRLRGIAKKSQILLAAEAGLAHNFINDIESGKKWVSAETIQKLSRTLKAEPHQFFLAETKWNDYGAEIFSLYLNDFSDSVEKIVEEYRHRYIPESEDKDATKP